MKPPLVSSATPFLDINSNPVKTPNACSTIPHLLDIDPTAPFEFHFPSQDFWWDLSDLSSSEPEDDNPDGDLDVSFNSSFYHFLHDPNDEDDMNDEDIGVKVEMNFEYGAKNEVKYEDKENDVIHVNDEKEDVFVSKLLSTISKIAPKFIYNRRKHSMKRRKNRRKRKRISSASIEPELRLLW